MHFTQAINLQSIVQHGILPRTLLIECNEINAYISSQDRLDEENRAVSVSISAISSKIFFSKDNNCGHPSWVALLLNP